MTKRSPTTDGVLPAPTPRQISTSPVRDIVEAAGKALVEKAGDSIAPRKGGIPNEELEKRISHRLDLINSYLTDETYLGRLSFTSLKDIAVAEAIQLDKLMALRGVPSVIVGHTSYKKLDEVSSALLEEVKRRKLTVKAIERKVEIQADADLTTEV